MSFWTASGSRTAQFAKNPLLLGPAKYLSLAAAVPGVQRPKTLPVEPCVATCRQGRRFDSRLLPTQRVRLVNELVEATHQMRLRRVISRWSPIRPNRH
jgi:hypothetical protein